MSGQARPGEFELIRRYFAPLAKDFAGSFGLRDDAAVISPAPGCELVVTADAIVAGVHFLTEDPPASVAAKLLRVNLSDLAAMGAEPLAYVITSAWPRDLAEAWIADFADGLAADQERFSVSLAGGDTVSTDGPICLSLTAFGQVPCGQALRRNAAKAGDRLMVSGSIGDAGGGLSILRNRSEAPSAEARNYLVERYRLPEPRVALGPALRGIASACIDVSDGLAADLAHICEESAVGAIVRAEAVPISPHRRALGDIASAWTAGDDYELLFSVKAERVGEAFAVAERCGVSLCEIGEITASTDVAFIDANGLDVTPATRGYTHF